MKMLIISDIHGNCTALDAILAKEKDADLIVCAGDCVEYGFTPHEVIARLKEYKVLTVAGNHDRGILSLYDRRDEIRAIPDSALKSHAEYTVKHLTDEDFEYLRSLPDEVRFRFDGKDYLMTHTFSEEQLHHLADSLKAFADINHFSEIRAAHTDLDANAPLRIIEGHTHTAMVNLVANGKLWINPGSISYRLGPDYQSKGSDYIVLENDAFRFEHLYYDSAPMLDLLETLGFEGWQREISHSFWDEEILP